MMTRLAKVEEFIWRRIDNEVAVVRDDGLALHVLNKTAAHIWEQCDGTRSPGDVAASLCEHFDVTPEEASADVEDTIGKLEKLGLVVVQVTEGDFGQH